MMLVKPRYVNTKRSDRWTHVLFFGESPGAEEAKEGKAFVGPAGRILQQILDAELPGKRCVLDNVCPEFLGVRNKPDHEKLVEYQAYRAESIEKHKPRLIVLLGEHAYRAFSVRGKPGSMAGKTELRDGHTFVFSNHPAHALYQPDKALALLKKAFGTIKTSLRREPKPSYELIESEKQARSVLRKLAGKLCAFDLETSSLHPRDGHVLCAAIHTASGSYGFPLFHQDSRLSLPTAAEISACLAAWWPQGPRIAHNAKFETLWIHKMQDDGGMVPEDPSFLYDTMIQAWVLDENQPKNLNHQVVHVLQQKPYWMKVKAYPEFATAPLNELLDYNVRDAECAWDLHHLQRSRLDETQVRLCDNILSPLCKLLARMEERGIHVDCNELERLINETDRKITRIKREVKKQFPGLNVRSVKQMQDLCFKKFKLTPPVKTKTGYSVKKEVLVELAKKEPRLKPLAELRVAESLRSRVLEPWLFQASRADGYLHTQWGIAATVTGRLNSTGPNLQNVDCGGPQRLAMTSRFKGGRIIQGDYDQHELRFTAAYCGIDKMLKAFRKGEDVHALTAAGIRKLGTPCDRPTGKNINFGIIYGVTPWGLKSKYEIPTKIGLKLIRAWHRNYPQLLAFHRELEKQLNEVGYVENAVGFRRHLEDPNDRHQRRQAYNAPIQGSAVFISYIAMIELEQRLQEEGMETLLVGQVHDSIILDAPRGEVRKAAALLKKVMLGVNLKDKRWYAGGLKADIPLAVSIKVSDHFE